MMELKVWQRSAVRIGGYFPDPRVPAASRRAAKCPASIQGDVSLLFIAEAALLTEMNFHGIGKPAAGAEDRSADIDSSIITKIRIHVGESGFLQFLPPLKHRRRDFSRKEFNTPGDTKCKLPVQGGVAAPDRARSDQGSRPARGNPTGTVLL